MASQRLKNTLAFTDLAIGASVVLPHGLMTSNFRPLAPDIVFIPSPGLDVVTDAINVTLTNVGPTPLSGSVLVEAWHTIERTFNGVQNENLTVKPYIVVSSESGNAPPWPPLIPLGTDMRIYARSTGSDATGDGRTPATAYRTLARAVRDIPQVIPPNLKVTVDVTGLGIEVPPDNFTLPPFVAAGTLDLDFAGEFFPFQTAVNIQADPELVPMTPVSNATLAAPGDFVVSLDATSGRITLTLTGAPRPDWAANALKGKILVGSGGAFETCRIAASDTTFITLTRSDFASGVPTAPMRIMRETADIRPAVAGDGFRGGFTVASISTLTLGGLIIREPSVTPFFPALEIVNCMDVVAQLCTVFGLDLGSGGGFSRNQSCHYPPSGYTIFADGDFLGFRNSLVEDPIFFSATGADMFSVENTMSNTIETSARAWPGGQGASVFAPFCNFDGGGAVLVGINMGGGQAFIRNTKMDNFVSSAIQIAKGAGFIDAITVTGTGNGIGIVADNNTQVSATAGTNNPLTGLLGTAGADFKVGSLAPQAWTGAALNVVDPATLTRIYGS
jgi:hypothetical protein